MFSDPYLIVNLLDHGGIVDFLSVLNGLVLQEPLPDQPFVRFASRDFKFVSILNCPDKIDKKILICRLTIGESEYLVGQGIGVILP